MKRIVFAWSIIFLTVFFVTCDLDFTGKENGNEDVIVEYTDVDYSEDGHAITVYLDGSKPVPVKKAKRAMSSNLSRMAYDFIEVIFVNTSPATVTNPTGVKTLARTSWELGQSAGISGVDRGTPGGPGVDYLWDDTDDGTDGKALALMFVGRKDGKTLLGVGRILQVDRLPKMKTTSGKYDWGLDGLPVPVTPGAPFLGTIKDDTKSVTFWVESVKTGLLINQEEKDKIGGSKIEQNVAFDSFTSTTDPSIRNDARRSPLGRTEYPLYPLPEDPENSVVSYATYTFGGGVETFAKQIRLDSFPIVEKRFPRYLDGGRYLEPRSNVDTDSTVDILDTDLVDSSNNVLLAGYHVADGDFLSAASGNVIPLKFTTEGYGVFSFYIEIPVYMFTRTDFTDADSEANTKATNGGPDAEVWKVRTGLGPELFSLDNGLSSGGCVLMGVGVTALDWLEIEWGFVK